MKISHLLLLFFSLMLSGCSNQAPKLAATTNQAASLVGSLPAGPLQWKVITSMLNTTDSTMSTLYGNDAAVEYVRTHSQHHYPNGAILSLVTWTQAGDDRWFGAKIPNQVKSVEFVSMRTDADGRMSYTYQRYESTPLKMVTLQQGFIPNERTAFLLAQRAAVLP